MSVCEYSPLERALPPPSIRVCVSNRHTKEDMTRFVELLSNAMLPAVRRARQSQNDSLTAHSIAEEEVELKAARRRVDTFGKPSMNNLPSLSFPLLIILVQMYAWFRYYTIWQTNMWTALFRPWIKILKCRPLDMYFNIWRFLGSSTFYSLVLPLLLWNLHTRYVPLLAITYGLNCYVGNFLKNLVSTGELAPINVNEQDRVGVAQTIRNAIVHDKGWPSVTAINALRYAIFVIFL